MNTNLNSNKCILFFVLFSDLCEEMHLWQIYVMRMTAKLLSHEWSFFSESKTLWTNISSICIFILLRFYPLYIYIYVVRSSRLYMSAIFWGLIIFKSKKENETLIWQWLLPIGKITKNKISFNVTRQEKRTIVRMQK